VNRLTPFKLIHCFLTGELQNYFLGPLVIPPAQEGCLAQLLVVGPFRKSNFAD
jgi:hypothetical protein